MSINRDMRSYTLQRNDTIQKSPSGASKDNWINVHLIDVAVYKKNDMKVVASEKYIESTHTGLTHYKDITSEKYRLVKGEEIYHITDCNTDSRLTNLLLKVVT